MEEHFEKIDQLTYLYGAPVALAVVGLITWFFWWKIRPIIASVVVFSVYVMAAYMLWHGQFQNAVNVELVGLRYDLQNADGSPRALAVGGVRTSSGAVEPDDIYVPEYAHNAFEINLENEALSLKPGSGHDNTELVLSGGHLVTMAETLTPQIHPIADGDEIVIEGSDVLSGTMVFHQSPPARRWVNLSWQASRAPQPQVISLPDRSVVTAGSGEDAQILIKGLPDQLFEIKHRDNLLEIHLMESAALQAGGLKFESLNLSDLEMTDFPLSVPFEPGSEIGIGSEKSRYGGKFKVTSANEITWYPNAMTDWQLEGRETLLPFVEKHVPLLQLWPYKTLVYPLNKLTSRESSLNSSILYGWGKHGEWPNGAFLLISDPEVTLIRSDASALPPLKNPGLMTDGSLRFLQLRIDEKQGPGKQRIRDIKRVSTRQVFANMNLTRNGDQPVLDLSFPTPQIKTLEQDEEVEEDKQNQYLFSINDPLAFARETPNLRFSGLSDAFQKATVDIEITDSVNEDTFTVRTGGGERTLRYGEVFETEGDSRLLVKLTRREANKSLLITILAGGVVCILCCFSLLNRLGFFLLIFGTCYVAATRVLFSYALKVNYPYDLEALPVSLYLLFLIPCAIASTAGFARTAITTRRRLHPLSAIFIALAIAFAFVFGVLPMREMSGTFKMIAISGALIASMLMLMMICLAPFGIFQAIRRLVIRAARGIPYPVLFLATIIVVLLRVALAMMGWKEAAVLGGTRIALSLFFVPSYILLFVLGFCKLLADRRKHHGFKIEPVFVYTVFNGFLMACQMGSAFLVSDLGTYIYLIPPSLMLAAIGVVIVAGKSGDTREPVRIGGLLLFLPGILLWLAVASPVSLLKSISENMANEITTSENIITDRNTLRALQFLNPERLVEIGTDDSEMIAQDLALMANYANRGWYGEGFLNVRVVPAKRELCKNDNVAAIFLYGQFGMLGALTLSAAYMLIALSGCLVFHRTALRQTTTMGRMTAIIVGMIFAASSIYMIAANLSLLPFTGRNLYLLGLNSISDIYEGILLISLATFGLTIAYQASFRKRWKPKTKRQIRQEKRENEEPDEHALA